MEPQKIQITNEKLLENISSKFSELEFGNIYLMFSAEPGIQQKLLSSYKDHVSFINSPFNGAITIAYYYEIESGNRLKHIELINDMMVYPPIDGCEYLDKVLVIAISQFAENNIIVIETTGMGEDSIIRLTNYCLKLLERFKDKLIIIIDFYYSNSNKIFIALTKKELKGPMSGYLPVDLISLKKDLPFKIKLKQ
jgi:hypothetical protein